MNIELIPFAHSSRGRVTLALPIGVVVTGALLWWVTVTIFSDNNHGAEADAPVILPATVAAQHERKLHLELPSPLLEVVHPLAVVQTGDLTEEGHHLPGTDPASVAHVPRGDNTSRLFVSSNVFVERYTDSSLAQLRAAASLLEDEVSHLMIDNATDYLDSGGGNTLVTDPAERDRETGELIMPPTGESHGLMTVRRTEVLPNGQLYVRTGELPWDEYTSFYDTQDELFWLRREIKRQRQLALTSTSVVASDRERAKQD